MRYVILFSPAIVLLAMTVGVAFNDGNINGTMLIAFLAFLTLSVVAAEIVRFQLRQETKGKRERD